MNNLLRLNIQADNGNLRHSVEYCIYTSMTDVEKNSDVALNEFLHTMKWDTNDSFEHPIVRIYNILDEEGKPIDGSHIVEDMDTFIFFVDNQIIREIHFPEPIYFTSILDMFDTAINSTEPIEKYKNALAYECMQFELAGFFNIRAMARGLKFVPFVYANESAQKVYSKLINPML